MKVAFWICLTLLVLSIVFANSYFHEDGWLRHYIGAELVGSQRSLAIVMFLGLLSAVQLELLVRVSRPQKSDWLLRGSAVLIAASSVVIGFHAF